MGITSFGADLAKAIDPKNQELQMILGIVAEITATILAIAGGTGLSRLSEVTESVTKNESSFFKRLMPQLMDSMDEKQIARSAQMMQAGAGVGQATAEIGNALQDIKTAEITADVQERTAMVNQLEQMEKMNNNKINRESSHLKTLIQGFEKMTQETQNALLSPVEAVVRALSQNV